LNSAGIYTPASIQTFVDAAKAITNLNPKNYTGTSNVTSWGSQMSTAYTNYTNAVNGLKKREFELTYENLFHLTDWAYSESANSSNSSLGQVKYDFSKGTITVNTTGTEVYSSYSPVANHYSIPVKGNTEYRFEANMKLDAGTKGQMFVFFYDANGKGLQIRSKDGKLQVRHHNEDGWSEWGGLQGDGISFSGDANASIALSESVENFSYIEVYYSLRVSGTDYFQSVKVHDPQGKICSLLLSAQDRIGMGAISFNINEISFTANNTFNVSNLGNAIETNEIYITKVVGYR
jgi:hypothetical protein